MRNKFEINTSKVKVSSSNIEELIENQGRVISYIKRCRTDMSCDYGYMLLQRTIEKKKRKNLLKGGIKNLSGMLYNLKVLESGYQRGMSALKEYQKYLIKMDTPIHKNNSFYVPHYSEAPTLFAGFDPLYSDYNVGLPFLLKHIHKI